MSNTNMTKKTTHQITTKTIAKIDNIHQHKQSMNNDNQVTITLDIKAINYYSPQFKLM